MQSSQTDVTRTLVETSVCETTFGEKAVNYLIKRLNSDCVEEAIADVAGAVGSKIRKKIKCTGCQLLVTAFSGASLLPGIKFIGARARLEEGGLLSSFRNVTPTVHGAYGFFFAVQSMGT